MYYRLRYNGLRWILSPLGVAALWYLWALWLVLQTTWSFAGLGVRYHHVLDMARLPGNLDIQGLCKLARV